MNDLRQFFRLHIFQSVAEGRTKPAVGEIVHRANENLESFKFRACASADIFAREPFRDGLANYGRIFSIPAVHLLHSVIFGVFNDFIEILGLDLVKDGFVLRVEV